MEKIIKTSEWNLEDVITDVVKKVSNDMKIVENNEDAAKWSTVTSLLRVSSKTQNRIMDYLITLDDSNKTINEKIILFINLSSIIVLGDFKIDDYEDSELDLILNYFVNKNISSIDNSLKVICNKELISTVRNKVIENDSRVKLLDFACFMYNNSTIDEKKFNIFIQEIINDIIEKDYYELIKKMDV